MASIKISDLPKDMNISKAEMRRILGGIGTWPTPDMPYLRCYFSTSPMWFGKATSVFSIDTVPLPD